MGFGTAISATAPEWDSAQMHVAAKVGHTTADSKKNIMWKCNLRGCWRSIDGFPVMPCQEQDWL